MHDPSLEKASSSVTKAFFLLVKAYIGTGVLFLPKAFYEGGFWFSFVILIFIAMFVAAGMVLLAEVYQEVPGSFEDIGGKVFGNWFRYVILASVAISQIGFCVAYFGFVAKTGENLLKKQFKVDVSKHNFLLYFILLQIMVYIPITYFRRIQKLAGVSLLANVLIFIGLIVICVFAGKEISQASQTGRDLPELNFWFRGEGFEAYFGKALYTFEGIGLVVPITQSMRTPEKFTLATILSMLVTIVIYLTVASMGAVAYGKNASVIILENLPVDPAIIMVHFFYIIAIVLSWGLVAYPAIEIIEKMFLPHARGRYSLADKWKKNILRSTIVILAALLSYYTLEFFGTLLTIIGCFACVPLSFIYPAMLHYKVMGAKSIKRRVFDVLLGLIGAAAMIVAFALIVMKLSRGESFNDSH